MDIIELAREIGRKIQSDDKKGPVEVGCDDVGLTGKIGGFADQVVLPVQDFGDYGRMHLIGLLFIFEADQVTDGHRIGG